MKMGGEGKFGNDWRSIKRELLVIYRRMFESRRDGIHAELPEDEINL